MTTERARPMGRGARLHQARPRRRPSPLQRSIVPLAAFSAIVLVLLAVGTLTRPAPATTTGTRSPGTGLSGNGAGLFGPAIPPGDSPRGEGGGLFGPAVPPAASEKPERTPRVTPPRTSGSPSPVPTTKPREPQPDLPPGTLPSGRPPAGFDMRQHVVPILFPIARGNDYRYRDNFLNLRDGKPRGYNHVALAVDGTLERRHDGIDIYVRAGTPIVSPFDGVVINPGWRWKPWYPERYGVTVAVLSTQRGSRGYLALMSHLETATVRPGEKVKRGHVIGTQGDTGNAEGQAVHLHFELRSPFLFAVREAGAVRRLDAFNPYASLVAADPRRR